MSLTTGLLGNSHSPMAPALTRNQNEEKQDLASGADTRQDIPATQVSTTTAFWDSKYAELVRPFDEILAGYMEHHARTLESISTLFKEFMQQRQKYSQYLDDLRKEMIESRLSPNFADQNEKCQMLLKFLCDSSHVSSLMFKDAFDTFGNCRQAQVKYADEAMRICLEGRKRQLDLIREKMILSTDQDIQHEHGEDHLAAVDSVLPRIEMQVAEQKRVIAEHEAAALVETNEHVDRIVGLEAELASQQLVINQDQQ